LDHHLALQIIDNGKGFNLAQTVSQLGHGLVNMRERAHQLGGEFDIISSPGEGTTVTTRLPLNIS
jgi:signal transduction histidine kinase